MNVHAPPEATCRMLPRDQEPATRCHGREERFTMFGEQMTLFEPSKNIGEASGDTFRTRKDSASANAAFGIVDLLQRRKASSIVPPNLSADRVGLNIVWILVQLAAVLRRARDILTTRREIVHELVKGQ